MLLLLRAIFTPMCRTTTTIALNIKARPLAPLPGATMPSTTITDCLHPSCTASCRRVFLQIPFHPSCLPIQKDTLQRVLAQIHAPEPQRITPTRFICHLLLRPAQPSVSAYGWQSSVSDSRCVIVDDCILENHLLRGSTCFSLSSCTPFVHYYCSSDVEMNDYEHTIF